MHPTSNNHRAVAAFLPQATLSPSNSSSHYDQLNPQYTSSSDSSSSDRSMLELSENIISLRPVPIPPSLPTTIHSSSGGTSPNSLLHVNSTIPQEMRDSRVLQLPPSYSALISTSYDELPEVRRPDSIMLELMGMVMTEENDQEDIEIAQSTPQKKKKKEHNLTPQNKRSSGLSEFFRKKLFKEQSIGPLNISISSNPSSTPPNIVGYSSPISNTSSTVNLIPSSPMPSPIDVSNSPHVNYQRTGRNITAPSPLKQNSPQQQKELKRKQKWDDKIRRMREEINSFGFKKQDKNHSQQQELNGSIVESPNLMFERANGQSLGDVLDDHNEMQDDNTLIQKPAKHFISNYFSSKFMKDSKNPFTVNRTVNQEFKKTPFLTISLTVVQIIMFVVSIGLGGLESILVNPLIGPPEAILVQLGAKQGTLIGSPNWQLYRLITPIFLHGGIVHLCLNMIWQMSVMLPLERHWGFVFICLVYLISGLGGNLLSALFLPEIVTVGASSSLFGILGGIYADLWMNWRYMPSPKRDFILISIQVIAQVIVGLIPWIDNFAHVGGLLVGFLTTMIFIPPMRHPNPYEEQAEKNGYKKSSKAPQRRKLFGNSINEKDNHDLENDLEKGENSKWKKFSKSRPFKIVYSFSSFFCCCFFCCSGKTRRMGKFTWWVRIVCAGLLFSYFAIFGGLYFSQMDWSCKWCYVINPDWDTLYEIFEVVREKIQ